MAAGTRGRDCLQKQKREMARRAQPGNKTVGKLTSKKDIRKANLGGNQAKRWTITGKKGGSTNQPLFFEPVFRSLGGGGEKSRAEPFCRLVLTSGGKRWD